MLKKCLFFAVCFAVSVSAVSLEDVGRIALSVVVPDVIRDIDASHRPVLETRIKQVVSGAGLAASGGDGNFIIYPNFTIIQTDLVETGMQNITRVRAEITLFVKQVDNGLLFGTVSREVTGSGRTKNDAIRSAIQALPTRHSEFTAFLENSKERIVEYYEVRCWDIIGRADGYIRRQMHEEAIAVLLTIPEEVAVCYAKITGRLVQAFNAHQNQICRELMHRANTLMAARDHFGALEAIGQISPLSNCYAESMMILQSIETAIEEQEREKWNLAMRLHNEARELEQRNFQAAQARHAARDKLEAQKIEAAKAIKIERLRNQPTVVYRNIIWW
ncbi:MAG: hypothetical protein FWE23_08740 [Chitinivibrionia bacterium]|nr:hypothetical protein [Chitinivibrionia bacterium]